MRKVVEYSWRVVRIQGNKAAQICIIKARDCEAAIKKAAKEFSITDPHDLKRLAAHRWE